METETQSTHINKIPKELDDTIVSTGDEIPEAAVDMEPERPLGFRYARLLGWKREERIRRLRYTLYRI